MCIFIICCTADEHYHTLREIIYCYENAKLPLVAYRTNCLHEKLKPLVEADRAALISYLNSETATCAQIDQQVVDSYVPPAPTSTRSKRKAEEISSSAVTQEGAVSSVDAERLAKVRSKYFPLHASKSSVYNVASKVSSTRLLTTTGLTLTSTCAYVSRTISATC